jgi:DNA-binding response OmpR family regulator
MSKNPFHILLAEDDLHLGLLLVDYLESEGFEVKLCKDGEKAWKAFQSGKFDLCLLDVMMPEMDGFTLAAAIRKVDQQVPVMFITARSMKDDKLKGYDLGADDYIVKPFDEEELLWKIKALVRRIPAGSPTDKQEILQLGKYRFDVANQSLLLNGKTKRITGRECDILAYLASRQNQVVKREELLTNLWGENDYFFGRSLDVFITKIRKYLKDDPNLKIENVFGVGFVLKVE